MSNNIIDAVTQTVNSLVSALKLPDESMKKPMTRWAA